MADEPENHPKIHHLTRLGDLKSAVALRILSVAPKVGEKAASHLTLLQAPGFRVGDSCVTGAPIGARL